MKPESKLWQFIKPLFPQKAQVNRVESHATSIGYPDIEFAYCSVVGTLELKAVPNLETDVKVRPAQIGWCRRRLMAGVNPLFLFWVKDIDNYFLIKGSNFMQIGDITTANMIAVASVVFDRDEMKNQFIDWVTTHYIKEV